MVHRIHPAFAMASAAKHVRPDRCGTPEELGIRPRPCCPPKSCQAKAEWCAGLLRRYPPGEVSVGLRQRSTKTQAGAVGVVGQPVAHDDNMQPINSAAIIKGIYSLISLLPPSRAPVSAHVKKPFTDPEP
jgi:hypothetical protein